MGTIEAIVRGTLYALIANILVLRLHLLIYFILLLPRKGGNPPSAISDSLYLFYPARYNPNVQETNSVEELLRVLLLKLLVSFIVSSCTNFF